MQRRSISGTEYETILGDLTIKRMHAGAMAIVIGEHGEYGRVILIKSGFGFALIADQVGIDGVPGRFPLSLSLADEEAADAHHPSDGRATL